jgi:hypothetical protein
VISAGSVYVTSALPGSSDCPLTYTLKTVSPDATYSGSDLTLDSSGKLTVDTNTLSDDNYKILITSNFGFSAETNSFNVKVTCGSSSNTITQPSTLGKTQDWVISTSQDPEFSVDAFSVAQAACPITAIDIFDAKVAGTSPPTDMTPGSIATPTTAYKVYVTTAKRTTKATYKFYMRLTLAGGMTYWANDAGDEEFVLNVKCAPMSLNTTPSPTNPNKFAYNGVSTTISVGDWSTFFENPGLDNCVMSSCDVYDNSDCLTAYAPGELSTGSSSPFTITANRNIDGGWTETVCVKCSNG